MVMCLIKDTRGRGLIVGVFYSPPPSDIADIVLSYMASVGKNDRRPDLNNVLFD